MADPDIRPLHLHTVESLCADLISGRPVGVGVDNTVFALSGDAPRAVLDWYRRNAGRWATDVRVADAEALVDAALAKPPTLPTTIARSAGARTQRLTLTRIEAHRFSGLHAYGPVDRAPPVFVYEPRTPVTLFEGLNASGKTSLLNAIIWALTGQILRPQRAPESGTDEFECRLDGAAATDDPTVHRLSSVTPLPDPSVYRPVNDWVAADTWVELTFADETGASLRPIRRTQTRTARGKLEETSPDLSSFGLDPIALRTGTLMPGMLPFIQVGSASELGKAVAQLTGLATLADLAGHARRAKRRIDGDFVTARTRDIGSADEAYNRTRTDLIGQFKARPTIAPAAAPPVPSNDATIEVVLKGLIEHFEQTKATALRDAQTVLGDGFDAEDADARSDLENNIAPALAEVQQLGRMPSAARLAALAKLTSEEIANSRRLLGHIVHEAETLATLAREPSRAARIRLYARVAVWVQEHPNEAYGEDRCAVCGGDLHASLDPVTGRPVAEHLHEANAQDATLLAQTLQRWATGALGALTRELPVALQVEVGQHLPEHPSSLVRAALIDELLATQTFTGVLSALKRGATEACDAAIETWPALPPAAAATLPSGLGNLSALQDALDRLDRALRFAAWRHDNDAAVGAFYAGVIGLAPKAGRETTGASLTGCLLALQSTVKAAEPINVALTACGRLQADLAKRRAAELRLAAYGNAGAALQEVISLGALVERQVEQLRVHLHANAAMWRSRIYAGAFPSTEQNLVATGMTSEGRLELLVGARGVVAPAQHVSNASALRASIVGFFFAFWEYVLKERGGLRLLLLDDPQELLDEENRERLAQAFAHLLEAEAQLIVTTYDRRFASHVATVARKASTIDHRSIHPVTPTRPTLQTAPSVADIQQRREAYEASVDDPAAAREYAAESRIFLETRLGDLFDDAAYPAWSATNVAPTLVDHLNRLRGLVRAPPSDLFRSRVMRALCEDPALADGAATLALLNKAHHQRKHEIRPQEVATAAVDLIRLRNAAEKAHEECRRWRRRENADATTADIVTLTPIARPNIRIVIHPDLAAFTRSAAMGESQDVPTDRLNGAWFNDKALFYLRCDNFGFAAPRGAIVIVEATPSAVRDRTLVIARRNGGVFARRLLRSAHSGLVALAAETPDPRNSPQTLLLSESELALHQVVGVLFDDRLVPPRAKTEAVAIDRTPVLERIETAHRVREESAVPLALPGQIALGGQCISLDQFGRYEDGLVALSLDDGSSLFKRIGASLPAPLSHLRQFESIGGLGASQIVSLGAETGGLRRVAAARLIVGVLYHG